MADKKIELVLTNKEWDYILGRIAANVKSDAAMQNFYNDKNSNVVTQEVQEIINTLDIEEAKSMTAQQIKQVIDLQTKIYNEYKENILRSIETSKWLKTKLFKEKPVFNEEVFNNIIQLFEDEVVFNKALIDEYKKFKQEDLVQATLQLYLEKYPDIDLDDPELVEFTNQKVKEYIETDPEFKKVFASLQAEVNDRTYILDRLTHWKEVE